VGGGRGWGGCGGGLCGVFFFCRVVGFFFFFFFFSFFGVFWGVWLRAEDLVSCCFLGGWFLGLRGLGFCSGFLFVFLVWGVCFGWGGGVFCFRGCLGGFPALVFW